MRRISRIGPAVDPHITRAVTARRLKGKGRENSHFSIHTIMVRGHWYIAQQQPQVVPKSLIQRHGLVPVTATRQTP